MAGNAPEGRRGGSRCLKRSKQQEQNSTDEPTRKRKGTAALALSQRGAREIVGYAKAHPRAKLAALEAAGHVSHSTLQRRLVQLEAAGVMRNAGTLMRPLWQIACLELAEKSGNRWEAVPHDEPTDAEGIGPEASADTTGPA